MVYEELEGILTQNEIKVYVALLKLGESKASPLLKKTGLQNSVFYRTINRLIEKGYVKYILKSQTKSFIAANPELIITNFEEQKEKAQEIVSELKKLEKDTSQTQAEIFVGLKGIKAMHNQIEIEAKEGENYMFFGADKQNLEEVLYKIYAPLNLKLNYKKIKVRGLDNQEIKKDVKEVNKENNVEVRYTEFPLPPNMAIFGDKITISVFGESPVGILIKNKYIAEKYAKLFEQIWKLAKK